MDRSWFTKLTAFVNLLGYEIPSVRGSEFYHFANPYEMVNSKYFP